MPRYSVREMRELRKKIISGLKSGKDINQIQESLSSSDEEMYDALVELVERTEIKIVVKKPTDEPGMVGAYDEDKKCWATDGQLAFLRFVFETEAVSTGPLFLIDKIRNEQVLKKVVEKVREAKPRRKKQ